MESQSKKQQSNPSDGKSNESPDLVNVQQKLATLDQLLANYNQLYKTYLQEVESEVNKKNQRKYPYTIKNASAFENVIAPSVPFPSNGNEEACFKSCLDTKDCRYALYSNSGCGIDCNPNRCLLYGANAGGITPVAEAASVVPQCPTSSGQNAAWCKNFNDPAANAIIPVLVIRTGNSDWRTLAGQLPRKTVKPQDAPFAVDLTTNMQWWNPDIQFSEVNVAPHNQISLQFRYFAEYWLNAYKLQSASTPVVTGQGVIGTFTFSKLNASQPAATAIPKTPNMTGYRGRSGIFSMTITGSTNGGAVWGTDTYTDDSDISRAAVHAGIIQNGETKTVYIEILPGQSSYNGTSRNSISTYGYGNWGASYKFVTGGSGDGYVGSFAGRIMYWNSNQPTSGGAAAGAQMAAYLASNVASKKFKYNYSAFENPVWNVEQNTNAMMGKIPPQLAQSSVPSWKFLGLHDSAAACQTAAANDPTYVYTTATYFNASYSNPKNGNTAFARSCYGNVAGAPSSDTVSASDNNVQSMTPPYGYTKLGGKNGILILKKMYQLNKQIMALTDDLKLSNPKAKPTATASATASTNSKKEAFEQRSTAPSASASASIESLSEQLRLDQIQLGKTISKNNYLDAEVVQSDRLLLNSRIKLGFGIVLGILMGYMAYRFFTSNNDVTKAVKAVPLAAAAAITTTMGMNNGNGDGMDSGDMDMDMDMDMGNGDMGNGDMGNVDMGNGGNR